MNPLAFSLCWSLALPACAGPAVTNLVLNPREVVTVLVATDRLTTISFPSAIAHLEAAYVSTEAEPPARFQLAFRPGHSFFSVRALGSNATATINVVWNRGTYVFELLPSTAPTLAVNLVEPKKAGGVAGTQPPSPHRLLGLLDTAKAYSLLRVQHPEEVGDVQYAPRRDRYDFGGYEITLEEVFRFPSEDTLVFRIVIHNQAGAPLRYLPQTFRVRAGERTFFAAITDGEGTVPPQGRTPVYFAVTSATDGTRHSLALDNEFVVLMTVPEPSVEPPTPPKRGWLKIFQRR